MRKFVIILFLVSLAALFFSCGDKLDLTEVQNVEAEESGKFGDTVYIPVNPPWEGFNKPKDLIVGKDQFIYVADKGNNRIVMLNLDGELMGETEIQQPIALAQDYRLNLFVCAEFDTTINNQPRTYAAVYKINLFQANHDIDAANMKRILPRTAADLDENLDYTGVGVFYDNRYYIARTGPDNPLINPDNSVLHFQQKKTSDGTRKDTLIGRVPLLAPEGQGLMSANHISSITTFDRPNYDMIITLLGKNSFKTQVLQYVVNPQFEGYQSKFSTEFADILEFNKFGAPEDAVVDFRGNIFVADAEKDSIFKFNSFGDELQSFGGSDVFNGPSAVGHFDRTLYIADTENDRILRFILSTDVE
jgi:DNA-binding beta-propeller fold protein YncE